MGGGIPPAEGVTQVTIVRGALQGISSLQSPNDLETVGSPGIATFIHKCLHWLNTDMCVWCYAHECAIKVLDGDGEKKTPAQALI